MAGRDYSNRIFQYDGTQARHTIVFRFLYMRDSSSSCASILVFTTSAARIPLVCSTLCFFRPLRFDIHMGALWKRPACMRIKYKHEYFVYFYDLIIHFIWSILNILCDKFLLSSNTIRTYIWWHMMGLEKIIQNRCIPWGTHLCQAYMYITLLKLVFSLKHPLKH